MKYWLWDRHSVALHIRSTYNYTRQPKTAFSHSIFSEFKLNLPHSNLQYFPLIYLILFAISFTDFSI